MASDGLNPEGRPSRYKSVRKAQSSESSTAPPVPSVPTTIPENGDSNGVARSRSRYHRSASVSQSTQPSLPNRTRLEHTTRDQIPALPKLVAPRQPSERKRSNTVGVQQHPPSSSRGEGSGNSSSRTPRRPTTSSRNQGHGRQGIEPVYRTEGERIMAQEQARYDRIKAQQRADREAKQKAAEYKRLAEEREQEERDRIAREAEEEEQRKRDEIANEQRRTKEEAEAKRKAEREDAERRKKLRRLKKEDISGPRPANIRAPTMEEYDNSPPLELPSATTTPTSLPHSAQKFGGFFKRRQHESPSPPKSTQPIRPTTSHASPPKLLSFTNGTKRSAAAEMPMIKPGGKGIVPLTDAPVSASNHGERRVRIQCGKKFIDLPFTPTTSALQLIRSTATVMSECPDPRTAVMYEDFTKCGIQRPLRMYEHVRNVVNSWDVDTQHSLLIVPSDADLNNELYKDFAPKEKAESQSWWLYYSPKANKWDKRWVTMREDGQVSMAKNEAGKDSTNICHLSDFETYTPTVDWKKRVVKPPKKYCYCVKSQQKSSMFEELTNFIHYFCSNDKQIADSFFSAIQNWRSWYIYNVMGEGQASKGEQKETKTGPLRDKSDEPQAARNTNRDSYYALGTFNTLELDFTSFAKEPERPQPRRRSYSFSDDRPLATLGLTLPSAQEHSRTQHIRQPSVSQKERSRPPVAYRGMHDSGQSNHRTKPSWNSQNSGEGAFNPSGLLGQQYEERQQNLQAAENGGGLNRSASQRSTRTMHRRNSIDGGSIRAGYGPKPKPLVDLTPQYREPPQHLRKGKGFKPELIPHGGLVDAIPDNIEIPYQMPSANEWKARPTTSSGNHNGMQRQATLSNQSGMQRNATVSGHHRSKSVKAHGTRRDNSDERAAFSGLLAKSGPGWGHGDKGHGVISGNLANGPLVDLREKSQFAENTLVRSVELRGGGNGDSRRKEKWKKVARWIVHPWSSLLDRRAGQGRTTFGMPTGAPSQPRGRTHEDGSRVIDRHHDDARRIENGRRGRRIEDRTRNNARIRREDISISGFSGNHRHLHKDRTQDNERQFDEQTERYYSGIEYHPHLQQGQDNVHPLRNHGDVVQKLGTLVTGQEIPAGDLSPASTGYGRNRADRDPSISRHPPGRSEKNEGGYRAPGRNLSPATARYRPRKENRDLSISRRPPGRSERGEDGYRAPEQHVSMGQNRAPQLDLQTYRQLAGRAPSSDHNQARRSSMPQTQVYHRVQQQNHFYYGTMPLAYLDPHLQPQRHG